MKEKLIKHFKKAFSLTDFFVKRDTFAFWGILIIAINFVMLHGNGYSSDLSYWRNWILDMQQSVGGFSGDYPPLYALWLRAVSVIYNLTGFSLKMEYELKQFCLFPVFVAHLSLALFVWQRLQNRSWTPEIKTIVMLLVVANPILYLDGPVWGQVDLLPVAFCVWALWYAAKPSTYGRGMALFMLGLLTKFQMIMFLPIFAALSLRYRKVMWRGLASMAVVFLLVFLPFILAGAFTKEFSQGYLRAVNSYPYATMNAGNLWMVVSGNMTPQMRPIFEWAPAFMNPALLGKILFVIISATIMVIAFIRRLSIGRLMMLSSLNALAFFMFLPCMHERYVFPAAIMAIAGIACQRRPAIIWAVLLSMVAYMNIAMVTSLRGNALWFWISVLGIAVTLPFALYALAPTVHGNLSKLYDKVAVPKFVPFAILVLIYVADLGSSYIQQAKTAYHLGEGEYFVYDLKLIHQWQGYGNMHIGKTVDGNPLHVDGLLYLSGIGTHAPSKQIYELPENANRFTVTCGVDDESGNGVLEFIVKLDGKELWRSGRMEGRQSASADLDIRGGHEIILETDELGDKGYDHADWVNPVVYTK